MHAIMINIKAVSPDGRSQPLRKHERTNPEQVHPITGPVNAGGHGMKRRIRNAYTGTGIYFRPAVPVVAGKTAG